MPIARESKGSWSNAKVSGWHEDTPRRYLALTRRPLVECYGSDELAARTQATDGRKAGPFKLGGRVSIIGGLLEFPIHRVDTIAHLCLAVLSVLPETRAIPGSEPLHMYAFLMCVQKSLRTVPPRALSVYDGVSTPFISRTIWLHEEASTKVTSGFETGCVFASIARFQPRTLNKQGIDRASVNSRLGVSSRSTTVRIGCRH